MTGTAFSVAGMVLGSQLVKCSARDSAVQDLGSDFDLMKGVKAHRKIDSHAHVYFEDDSGGHFKRYQEGAEARG